MSFVSSSKFLQKKWELRDRKFHKRKIKSIRTKIDTSSPKTYPHLIVRLKKIEKEEQRQSQIDQENQILLQKMSCIMSNPSTLDNWNEYEAKSLNHTNRLNEQDRIAEQNLLIARRLQNIKPEYDYEKWREEYFKHEYIMDMLSMSTKDFGLQNNTFSSYRGDEGDISSNTPAYDSDRPHTNRSSNLPRIVSMKSTIDEDVHQLYRACKQLAKADEVILKTLINKTETQRDLKQELCNVLGKDYHVLLNCLFSNLDDEVIEQINTTIKEKKVGFLIDLLVHRYQYQNINTMYEKKFENSIQDDVYKYISDKGVKVLVVALFKISPEILNSVVAQTILEAEPKLRFTKEHGPFIISIREKNPSELKDLFTDFKMLAENKTISQVAKSDGCSKRFVEAIKNLEKSVNFSLLDYVNKIHSFLYPNSYDLIKLLLVKSQFDMNAVCRLYKQCKGVQLIEAIMQLCGKVSPLVAHLVAKQSHEFMNKELRNRKKSLPSLNKHESYHSAPVSRARKQISIQKRLMISGSLLDDIRNTHECILNLASNIDSEFQIKNIVNALSSINNRQLFKRVYFEEFDNDLSKELENLMNETNLFILSYFYNNIHEFHTKFFHEIIEKYGVYHNILILIIITSSKKTLEVLSSSYMKLYNQKLSILFNHSKVLQSFFDKEYTTKTFKRMAELDCKRLITNDNYIDLEVLEHILINRTLSQMCLIFTEFDKEHEDGFVRILEFTEGSDKFINIVKCICHPLRFACCIIMDIFDNSDDIKLLSYTLLTHYGKKMPALKNAFKQLNDLSLESTIEEKVAGTSALYFKALLSKPS